MDISVSRLNNRMVLQVPPELPLGLVFVVGQVQNLHESIENAQPLKFDLVEAGYRLRCQLSSRVANDVLLQEGDMVRAGGHLAFDTQAARYFLLARDLEIVPDIAGTRTKMAPILADIKKRAEAAELVRTELPQWVKQLAPPEVQEELGLIEDQDSAAPVLAAGSQDADMDMPGPVVDMSEEMLSFLSEAIDREDDVEITPEVLAQFLPLESQPAGTSPAGYEVVAAPRREPALPPVANVSALDAVSVPPATTRPVARKTAPPQPVAPPPAPKKSNITTIQTLLLGAIAVLFFLLLIVVSLIALNLMTG